MSMATPALATPLPSKIGKVIRVTSGNFLEQYDFFLFGIYAKTIASVFFPSSSEYASLMATFAAFGAGFFMRPLGAIILGAYIDKVGRRKGLIVTLALMATGTLSIAVAPGYAQIGVFAPVIVVLGRLLQGFSAGAELGGVSVYLAEITTPGRKGFFTSWQSASQQISIVVAAALGFLISEGLSADQIAAWGWRIPFVIGCGIVPFIFILRRSLLETDEFLARRSHPSTAEVFRSMGQNIGTVLLGMLLVAMTTTTFYLITVYTPTFGQSVLKLSARDSLIVTFFVGISNFIWLPVGGALSDRFGRPVVLKTAAVATMFTAYPVLHWLAAAPSLSRLLIALLWLSLNFGMYNGAMVAALTEVMPVQVRVAGFSLAYSLATALFGGVTPTVSTFLYNQTNDRAAPALWLTFAAACGLIATIALYDSRRGRAARAADAGTNPAAPLPITTEP